MRNHSIFRLTCIIFIWLTLASCSRTQIAYNFSDWFLLKATDDFFQLNNSQRSFLEEHFDQLLEWHRTHELPEIIVTLSQFQERYRDGLDREDIEWLKEDERRYFKRFFIHAVPGFSQFLTTLEEDQVQHFKSHSEKKNDFLLKQIKMSDEELVEDTQQWFIKHLEDWFGTLDQDQKQVLRIWITVERGWIFSKLENRRKFQKAFAGLLESNKSASEIEAQLIRWMDQPETLRAPEYQSQWEEKKKQWMDILINFDALVTPDQRNRALEKVQDYINEFKSLAI